MKTSATILVLLLATTQSVKAEYEEAYENVALKNVVPEKVYISTQDRVPREFSEENCSYNDEHQHIHCVEKTRVVYQTNDYSYRDRGPSGLAVGLAIGLPLLIHSAYRHDYGRSYRNSYRHYNRHYSKRHHRRHKRRHHH